MAISWERDRSLWTRLDAGRRAESCDVDLTDLWPEQRAGALALARSRAMLLGDEPGSFGKTAQGLRSLSRRPKALVVCPKSACNVWTEQARRWRPDLRVSVSKGFELPRRRGDVRVCSYESLPDLRAEAALVEDAVGDIDLIVDECHRVKHLSAQRSRKLRALCRQVRSVKAMSGTPLEGTPEELWQMLDVLGLADKAFGSRDAYLRMWNARSRGDRVEWGDPGDAIALALRRVMLRRTRPNIVPVRHEERWVEAPDIGFEFNETRLEDYSRAGAALAAARIEDTLACVAELRRSSSVLVFSMHVAPVLAVGSLSRADCIHGQTSLAERERIATAFQEGDLDVLGIVTTTAGEALTLTAASAAVFVDHAWNPTQTEQAIARIVRPGQLAKEVLVVSLTSAHPYDRHVAEINARKVRYLAGADLDRRSPRKAL